MYCTVCGREMPDNAGFCPGCGAAAPVAGEVMASPGIRLCPDGKYRWTYEMSLFRDPSIFLLVWRIFFFIFLGIFAMIMFFDTVNGYMDGGRLVDNLKIMGYVFIGMTVLVCLGYLVYAAAMGGKYIVDFEMDERGVNHKQTPAQAAKAKKIGALTAAVGAASGSLSAAGAGLNAQRTEMYSDFSAVRKVKPYPRRHLIKVNGKLSRNQVYASAADFDFVRDYIISHCGGLKDKEKKT